MLSTEPYAPRWRGNHLKPTEFSILLRVLRIGSLYLIGAGVDATIRVHRPASRTWSSARVTMADGETNLGAPDLRGAAFQTGDRRRR